MRRFEFNEGPSNKFWEIEQTGFDLNVRFGKIGTAGQSQTKNHPDAATAGIALAKLVKEKTNKGYIEIGAAAAPGSAPSSAPRRKAAVAVPPAPKAASAPPPPPQVLNGDVAPWLATGPVLELTPKMMQLALPSRRFPAAAPARDADACWELFLAQVRRCVVLDLEKSAPAFHPALVEAAARIKDGSRDGSLQSDVVLLTAETLYEAHVKRADSTPFVDFLVAHKGLPYALNVLLEMEKSSRAYTFGDSANLRMLAKVEGAFAIECSTFCSAELAFRAHLATADADTYAACAQTIRHAEPALHASRKPLLALLLPDEPALADQLALRADVIAHKNSAVWLRLCTSAAASLQALASLKPGDGYAQELFYDLPWAVATALREHGTAAAAILADGAFIAATAQALACIGTPDSMTALALACDVNKASQTRFSKTVQRWPLAAIAALAELIAADGCGPGPARAILSTLVHDHADQLDAFTPWISAPAAHLLRELAGQIAAPIDTAEPAELPPVLANPPWTLPPKKAYAPLQLATLALAPVERWSAVERAALMVPRGRQRYSPESLKGDPVLAADALGLNIAPFGEQAAAALAAADGAAVIAVWNAVRAAGNLSWISQEALIKLPEALAEQLWNAFAQVPISYPGGIIGRLGLRGLPGVVAMCERRPMQELHYALYFGAVELTVPVVRAYTTLKDKDVRATARTWLLANAEFAACALIAPALGNPGPARETAKVVLRLLAGAGHEATLLDAASRYQRADVNAALRGMLDEGPLDVYPAQIDALPDFWQPQGWPRPLLADNGKALPVAALGHLGTMLRFPSTETLYPGLALVKQACTPASLADFAWSLFQAWINAGAQVKEAWAFSALGLLGNDDTARKLTPFIRAWPGESQHARAVAGLDVLARIGSDTALMLLNGIAQKVKFKGLQDRAREKIGEVAEARQFTPEELEDRLAPDLGLDEQGAMLLDFGPRQFRVGFDEALKPYVRDTEGARLADLPKPKKSDDEALAGAAVERYKLLKKDARTIASQQVLRLELAMCTGRRWVPQVFRTFLAEHPLVRQLVQRIVWGAYELEPGSSYGGRMLGCFRVAPDGALTDAADDAFTLPPGAHVRIGIPHALELPAHDANAFGQLFADYELLQPFAQIGRDTYTLTADELAADKLLRWHGSKVPTGRVLGLANKGWRRGAAQDGGGISYFTKTIGASQMIELRLDPGIIVGMVDEYPEQTLREVRTGAPDAWGEVGHGAPMASLDPIAASELIRDLQGLCG
ncbi:putative DNA-binding WGR domain protein [Oxalobacteraceae bacterium GrIS 1.11]